MGLDPKPQDQSSEGRDSLLQIFDFLVDGKRFLFGGMLLFALLTITYAFLATPIYRVQAVLEPLSMEDDMPRIDGQLGSLAALAGVQVGTGQTSSTDVALATFQSHDFLASFIESEGLMSVIFEKTWVRSVKQFIGLASDHSPRVWDGVETLREDMLDITEDSETGLWVVALEWKDPDLAATWLKKLIDRINAHMRERALNDAEEMLRYLRIELDRTNNANLVAVIAGSMERQINIATMARARVDFAFRVVAAPVVPPADKYVRPRKLLLVVFSLFFGAVAGMLAFAGKGLFAEWYARRSTS